jgi:hypothetical protein
MSASGSKSAARAESFEAAAHGQKTQINRRPSASWDLVRLGRAVSHEIPAFAGMTSKVRATYRNTPFVLILPAYSIWHTATAKITAGNTAAPAPFTVSKSVLKKL